ncbi:hypothetical protein DM02DRAFT_511270 [Periconia macrospinosa]|uniref:Transcription initiation factor TFIID subunit 2 n=1 Tax=Periconia macrospinosa TaxID=97972 RepID=A0A2V1EDF2_9PLEO|nr:hypothetical protein DM02DRAFT_511270 [Periconia macrospinosa]
MDDAVEDPTAATVFTVLHQTLDLDFSFCPRRIKGKTTIEIQPQSTKLSEIQLHCRQLKVTRVTVAGREASFDYNNLYERLSLYPGTGLEQYHFPQGRIRKHEDHVEKELVISVPEKTRIKEVRLSGAQDTSCESLEVVIEYVLEDFRDAVHFAGVEDGDARYPHAYTRNSPFPGTASALFPCLDDGTTRGTFDVSIRYPRTVGDALSKRSEAQQAQAKGPAKADSVMSDADDDQSDLTEEEKALEMSVICSGLLTDEIVDPNDPTRMTASFAIETSTGILPQHLGIVIGPFQHVDLSEYRDTSEDDRLQDEAIKVHAFCLPGKEDEVRNSAMIIPRTLDNFTDKYQTYRFGKSYKMAFVDDLDCDTAHTMSLTICSSRLLFPETVWEPLEHTTRVLIHAVASQWIGVDVIAQEPTDYWAIVGGSWFMTEFYLRELFGRNDNRFRQKLRMDKVIQLDVRRPSLWELGKYLQVDPGEREFMELKSLSVLSVLHNRLIKVSGKNGVDRCLYRLLFQSGNGQLTNGAISTDSFLNICEKVGHQKMENFFNQWVYGSGCPTFECTPSFNKKKQVVQLVIKQTQADPIIFQEERSLAASDFLREAKEKNHGFSPDGDWPAFVGPMTIRIHEADGTPYEHIVDINSSTVKVEIPYNTKYKRLKRNRLNKERQAAAQGLDVAGEAPEDVTFYSLGDTLQSPEEVAEWKIEDWSAEDEQKMESEAYEWIRIDADFEWICKTNINDMPSYMYVSQLQQDKDVVAQVESIQYLARKQAHGLLSSILVKTLMDNRYFHGIRTMAADVLPNNATEGKDMIGLFHLIKAFRELFCLPNSPMTRSNDFSDRASYHIQCAIPKAIARIKGADGKAPVEVKNFLLDVMRYNNNRGNEYSDDYYLATLMRCLTECITTSKPSPMDMDPTLNLLAEAEEHDFKKKAIDELQRHLRLDEWIPTYHNVYTTTVLECEAKLIKNRTNPFKVSEFLQYTQSGNADNVRLAAWNCLVDLGIFNSKPSVARYMIQEIQSDPSPYFRAQLLRIFGKAIGQIAVGDVFTLDEPSESTNGFVVEDEANTTSRAAGLARRNLAGALEGLKKDLAGNETIMRSLVDALSSKSTSLRDISELLDVASLIAEPKNKLVVELKYPHYWKVERVRREGAGVVMRFYHSERIRTKPFKVPPPPEPVAPPPPPAAAPPSAPPAQAPVPPPVPRPALKLKLTASLPPSNVASISSPARTPTPTTIEKSVEPAPQPQRISSLAGQGNLAPIVPVSSPAPPSVSISAFAKSPVIKTKPMGGSPLNSPRPSPAPVPPTSASTPMEGVESTGSTPKSSTPKPLPPPSTSTSISVATKPPKAPKQSSAAPPPAKPASATPTSATPSIPKPKQSLSIKFGGNKQSSSTPKPPSSSSTLKPPSSSSKPSKSKKPSKIVKLKLAPGKLALIRDGKLTGIKRKAEGSGSIEQRPAKRQSTEPAAQMRGVGATPKKPPGWKNPQVRVERSAERLLVVMKLGKGKLKEESVF